ncbi:MAG: hypothetical protein M3O36_13505 [Myxococcota bacterium]|nr:hypothetical protein [Myxococcota bacterium]
MTIGSLACVLALTVACTPAETTASVVVSRPDAAPVLVRTTDTLSPGDIVHFWRRSCRGLRHCGYHHVAAGVVTGVILDAPAFALVELAPGDDVAVGDRAIKESPMRSWHPDPPRD